ncbi:hypothetical protein EYF80_034468 [Liparis tanakae]|uniref:Uncharacterized protein n=1 Tax=Liparis tanakae TaxID=230148 RepID=A0A4Z2GPF2_9TELE|nr:hypothetical protein EYF80_034468 [Liparis tanakae]
MCSLGDREDFSTNRSPFNPSVGTPTKEKGITTIWLGVAYPLLVFQLSSFVSGQLTLLRMLNTLQRRLHDKPSATSYGRYT